MKIVYFELSNGRSVPPFTCLPRYKAYVNKGKVMEIYTCFGTSNILENNQEWIDYQLNKEIETWEMNPLLMTTLNKYVRGKDMWFENINHEGPTAYNRFIYIKFWDEKLKGWFNR